MNERIRLRNNHDFNVGIITIDKPYGVNIAPHSFTIVSKDDLDFLMATSTMLQKGVLVPEGDAKEEVAEVLGIDMENNANFMSDEDIKKKLSMNASQLKKWLGSIEAEPYIMEKIAGIAKNMNLSMNSFHNLDRIAVRAQQLGMGQLTDTQIRVVNLPGLEDTSTQSAEAIGAEEMK